MTTKNLKIGLLSSELEVPPWELFHENSKLTRYSPGVSEEVVREQLERYYESLPYNGLPVISLPRRLPAMRVPLRQAILSRIAVRQMKKNTLTLPFLSALLHLSYGVNRTKAASGIGRSLRTVPSAGALFPLEIFLYSTSIVGLQPGIYHYNPTQHNLRLFRAGEQTTEISKVLVQNNLVSDSSLLVFITALFERSTSKYGDRGYRFTFLEAGHVAQNFNLVAYALGLGSLNIGGFFDRELDDFFGFDGITQSTIYIAALGFQRKT